MVTRTDSQDRLFLDDVTFRPDKNKRPSPNFSVQETAKAFFGRSPDWLRWRSREGAFVLDGERIEPAETESGARYYTLADIEAMAYALFDNGIYDIDQLLAVLQAVYANAYLAEVIPEPIVIETLSSVQED